MKICLTEKPKEIFINDAHISACWMNVKAAFEEEEAAK